VYCDYTIPHTNSEIIPFILIPAILIDSATKYEETLNANNKNVSVIGLTLVKLAYLKTKLVKKPNITPINSEMIPSIKNSPKIKKGVNH
jgi:hypothetical protein